MARGSAWISALGSLGATPRVAGATQYAASVFSRESGARFFRGGRRPAPGQSLSRHADACAARDDKQRTDSLPQGFVPLVEAKSMALLGRWELLEDKMPPCLPAKLLLTMQRCRALGDADASNWLSIYDRAFSGDAESQRLFGRVCEIGAFRAPVDLQRAYFWYHRAALQGDIEARHRAERLAQAIEVSPAVMAEPALVYSGAWRITADVPGAPGSTSFFELSESGAASGWMIGNNGHYPKARNIRLGAQYRGQWAYDGARATLSFDFSQCARVPAGARSDIWQITLLGCRTRALCGRDHRMVSYVLEYAGVE